MIIITYITL